MVALGRGRDAHRAVHAGGRGQRGRFHRPNGQGDQAEGSDALGRVRDPIRTNNLTRRIEEAFLAEQVPYRISGGTSFYGRKEVKDIISYLGSWPIRRRRQPAAHREHAPPRHRQDYPREAERDLEVE